MYTNDDDMLEGLCPQCRKTIILDPPEDEIDFSYYKTGIECGSCGVALKLVGEHDYNDEGLLFWYELKIYNSWD